MMKIMKISCTLTNTCIWRIMQTLIYNEISKINENNDTKLVKRKKLTTIALNFFKSPFLQNFFPFHPCQFEVIKYCIFSWCG